MYLLHHKCFGQIKKYNWSSSNIDDHLSNMSPIFDFICSRHFWEKDWNVKS